MIKLNTAIRQLIIEDAKNCYPDECCGFFYGKENADGDRLVEQALIINNAKEGDKRKRFEISPQDYMKGEQFASDHQLDFLGIYHSHPDHPAIPSEHDRVAAQPWFSYIIISVLSGKETALRSWRLNDDFRFEEEIVNQNSVQNINS